MVWLLIQWHDFEYNGMAWINWIDFVGLNGCLSGSKWVLSMELVFLCCFIVVRFFGFRW